jgi:predicted dehydrogenase
MMASIDLVEETEMSTSPHSPRANRRQFLGTAALTSGAVLASGRPAHAFHHSVDETLNVGLIGCGGRGNGAAINAANADPNVRITALCDVFEDRIESSAKALQAELGAKFAVDREHWFSGLDGYKALMASDVDVVLLCSTPYFRPDHMEEAVRTRKHIFCEKPIATDVAGSLRVWEACRQAESAGLNVVSGLCWRYDPAVLEVMRRIKDGAIGEIRAIQENYLTGTLWHRGSNPNWSPLEYQIRNWLYFTWLSGDLIAEQHIHSLDKGLWLMDDQPPVSCYGTGGRQVRVDPQWGNVYDHFACVFEWENGVKMFSFARQMAGCSNDTEDYVVGTSGRAQVLRHVIQPSGGPDWNFTRTKEMPDMYDAEHQELFKAIRAGKAINNGTYMCQSTLAAIMGREACYTGQKITWDGLLASNLKLGPEKLDWDDVPECLVAMPGESGKPIQVRPLGTATTAVPPPTTAEPVTAVSISPCPTYPSRTRRFFRRRAR